MPTLLLDTLRLLALATRLFVASLQFGFASTGFFISTLRLGTFGGSGALGL